MENSLTFSQKANIVKIVRKTAAQSCFLTFQKILSEKKKVSEFKFVNKWIKYMDKTNNIHGNWYQPPPQGCSALFFEDNNIERVKYGSLRDKKYWPKIKNYYNKEGGGYVFASPFYFVNDTPFIGDFGFSFYTGGNQEIKDHFRKCSIILNIFCQKIEPGMKFSQLYNDSVSIFKENGYQNFMSSSTDINGTNVGHTIPFLETQPSKEELEVISLGDEKQIYNIISKNRSFINEISDYTIGNNCGFTFEPRIVSINKDKLPMFSLHLIILFQDGQKEILSNFSGIINLLKIDYLYSFS